MTTEQLMWIKNAAQKRKLVSAQTTEAERLKRENDDLRAELSELRASIAKRSSSRKSKGSIE